MPRFNRHKVATAFRMSASRGRVRAFARDRHGNIAMIFSLALVPLVGGIGAAVDYSRATDKRAALQLAVDSAAIAGARQMPKGEAEVKSAVAAFMKGNMPAGYKDFPYKLEISQVDKRVIVSIDVAVPVTFMKAFGKDVVTVGAKSEARSGVENTEIVLALDTTGTMRNHMPALKQGAKDLVRLLFDARVASDDIKIGVVPYVASVNLGNHASRMSWMDVNARAKYHGENFRNFSFKDSRCYPPPPPPEPEPPVRMTGAKPPAPPVEPEPQSRPEPPAKKEEEPKKPKKPWSPDLGSLDHVPTKAMSFAGFTGSDIEAGINILLNAIGPNKANAGPWTYSVMDTSTPIVCPGRTTPTIVNHFDLFDGMNVRWKGCVEARPSPYDVTDQAPSSGTPDTLFVPYLWPDEADGNEYIRNDYLSDRGGVPDWADEESAEFHQAWIWKYKYGGTPNVDDTSFLTRGPNTACPDPIVPLTTSKSLIDTSLDALRAYAASGTNIAEGMAWAWRVISPGDPFPEGAPYDAKNKKFVVLMTDGINEVVPQGVDWNKSDYSAIGYAAKARLGTDKLDQITTSLDNNLTTVCKNMKDKDIKVFTILYDPVGMTRRSDIDDRLVACATKPEFAFKTVNGNDLVKSFRQIAAEIIKLRITR